MIINILSVLNANWFCKMNWFCKFVNFRLQRCFLNFSSFLYLLICYPISKPIIIELCYIAFEFVRIFSFQLIEVVLLDYLSRMSLILPCSHLTTEIQRKINESLASSGFLKNRSTSTEWHPSVSRQFIAPFLFSS